VEVEARTVGEALQRLVAEHRDLEKHLFDEHGRLRSFVNVYVNDEDVRYLAKDATVLAAGDVVSIVPSIAGGSPKPNVYAVEGTFAEEVVVQPPSSCRGRRRGTAATQARASC
jgi:adenylyltransferase/sulfurtransferase